MAVPIDSAVFFPWMQGGSKGAKNAPKGPTNEGGTSKAVEPYYPTGSSLGVGLGAGLELYCSCIETHDKTLATRNY